MKHMLAILAVVAALAIPAAATAGPGTTDSWADPNGGAALPACGSNQYYTYYNYDHTIWTCLYGKWYFGGSW